MTALVLYIADRWLDEEKKKSVVNTVKSCLCDGMGIDEADVTVVLESFSDENANERVAHCFFPVLYTPTGTPYAYKRKIGELMKERLTGIIGEENVPHCYFHMKEHDYDNIAINGKLLKFDDMAIKHLDETRGENSTPWIS